MSIRRRRTIFFSRKVLRIFLFLSPWQAYELGFANTMIFAREWPVCVSMDDIWFRLPVEIGAMLSFSSQVSYTQDNHIQTRVAAEVRERVSYYSCSAADQKKFYWGSSPQHSTFPYPQTNKSVLRIQASSDRIRSLP